MAEETFFDARGCLDDGGLAALARPQGVPADVAAHLASCDRCQDRALTAATGRTSGRLPRTRPTAGRTAAIIGLILLGAIVALYTMRWLVRG
jgi:hypothetical protein